MSWSYSFNPASSAKDAVRFFIGDTNSKDQLLHDEEITYLLGLYNQSPTVTAIRACEAIMTKFGRLADESVGHVRISFSQKAKSYAKIKEELRQRLAMEEAVPYAGGISVADKVTESENSDRVKPDFSKHMMENDLISPWSSDPRDLNERQGN